MRYLASLVLVLALGLMGCGETSGTGGSGGDGGNGGAAGVGGVDVPPAPDLEPVLRAYENPTVVVTSEIMAAVADEIDEVAEKIEDSELFAEILKVIADVQQELENGTNFVFDGVCSGGTNDGGDCADDTDCPDPGTCAVRINYICPGWDEQQFDEGYDAQPDPSRGAIDLFMTVESAGIGRVVWGTADQCLYLVPVDGDTCEAQGCSQASYDGKVALDLGPDWVEEEISELPVTFVVEGTIGLDGDDFPINQSFRVVLADEWGLVILVDIGAPALTETFSYIFAADGQAIRDATGSFGCSLEERRCFDESGTLFSW